MARILIACEFSGIVREAFRKQGHDAWSCDLLDTEIPGQHIKGNVLKVFNRNWDLIIGFPPCTYLANSGVQHLYKDKTRWKKMLLACDFFNTLRYANIDKICVENPVPHGYARQFIGMYDQIVQPYQFGHEVSKRTCLWLKKLPKLQSTNIVDKGERYYGKNGKSNGAKWYQLPSSSDRWRERSRTFPGIANAMAIQWGKLL